MGWILLGLNITSSSDDCTWRLQKSKVYFKVSRFCLNGSMDKLASLFPFARSCKTVYIKSSVLPGHPCSYGKKLGTAIQWDKFIEFCFELGSNYKNIKTEVGSRHGFVIIEKSKRFFSGRVLSHV